MGVLRYLTYQTRRQAIVILAQRQAVLPGRFNAPPKQDWAPGKRSPQPVKPSDTEINRIDTLRGIYRHLKKIA